MMNGIDSSAANVLAARQASLRSEIGFALAARQLAVQEQQGQAVVELLDQSAQLAKAAGIGNQVDLRG